MKVLTFISMMNVKGTVWHFGKDIYSLSSQELNEKIATTHMCKRHMKLQPPVDRLVKIV